MRTNLLVAAMVGLGLGLIVASQWPHADVQAQQPPPKVAYEYKVVEFGNGALNAETSDDMTTKLNKLAGDGWEYVGLVASPADDKRFCQGFVAFRRVKK